MPEGNLVRIRSGADLFVRDWGRGPPVLLLAGWGMTSDLWASVMLRLTTSSPGSPSMRGWSPGAGHASEALDHEHTTAATGARRAPIRGRGGLLGHDGRGNAEQLPSAGDIGLAIARGEQAVVTDAVEALGQNVHEEASDELVDGQRHGAVAGVAVAAVILVSEGDVGLVERDQAPVGDGDAVRVAGQVSQHGFGATEGRLGIHDPLLRPQWR